MSYKLQERKCLPNDCIKESNIVVRGVNSSNSVVGEVTLELQINEENTISTNALILKDANFSYDLILGRDLLEESQIDIKQKAITLNGERICKTITLNGERICKNHYFKL